jgi:hypothetical protein
MQRDPTIHGFDHRPEFIATRTYVRCVDRLFQSLPPRAQRRLIEPVLSAAVKIGSGIACLHGHPEPPGRFSAAEREESRQRALQGIWLSREWLDDIARVPGANRAELLVARELLDRIEGSVRAAVLPG